MTRTAIALVLLLAAGCAVRPPLPGDGVPRSAVATGVAVRLPGGGDCETRVTLVRGRPFSLCETDGRVVLVFTVDPGFETPEGISVGDAVRAARKRGGEPVALDGWPPAYPLPSGWYAGVPEGEGRIGVLFRVLP